MLQWRCVMHKGYKEWNCGGTINTNIPKSILINERKSKHLRTVLQKSLQMRKRLNIISGKNGSLHSFQLPSLFYFWCLRFVKKRFQVR